MKNILIVVGSFRKGSYNRQLAERVESLLAGRAHVSYLDYGDLPFINQDTEFPTPASVARVRARLMEADGIWICSPEHNHSIPAVLKNLLDWLSRPMLPDDPEKRSCARGKAATVSGAGGKSATAYGREAIKTVLDFIGMRVAAGTGTGIALSPEAYKSGVLNFSDETLAALEKQAEEFLAML